MGSFMKKGFGFLSGSAKNIYKGAMPSITAEYAKAMPHLTKGMGYAKRGASAWAGRSGQAFAPGAMGIGGRATTLGMWASGAGYTGRMRVGMGAARIGGTVVGARAAMGTGKWLIGSGGSNKSNNVILSNSAL